MIIPVLKIDDTTIPLKVQSTCPNKGYADVEVTSEIDECNTSKDDLTEITALSGANLANEDEPNCVLSKNGLADKSEGQTRLHDTFLTTSPFLIEIDQASSGDEMDSISVKSDLNPLSECFVPRSPIHFSEQNDWKVSYNATDSTNHDKKEPILLNCFYGLECNQVGKPSPHSRPRKFSSIWSATLEDQPLGQSLSQSPSDRCSCIPCFGFSPPLDFFGNPYCQASSCGRRAAPPRYSEETAGSVYPIRFNNHKESSIDEWNKALSSNEEFETRLEGYKKDFEQYVTEICSITEKLEGIADSKLKDHFHETCPEALLDGKPSVDSAETSWSLSKELSDSSYVSAGDSGQSRCSSPCSVWCDSNSSGDEKSSHDHTDKPEDDEEADRKNRHTKFRPISPALDFTNAKFKMPNLKREHCPLDYRTQNSNLVISKEQKHASLKHPFDDYFQPGGKRLKSNGFEMVDNLAKEFQSENWIPLPDCIQMKDSNVMRKVNYRQMNPVLGTRISNFQM